MNLTGSANQLSRRADISALAFAAVFPFAAAWLYLVVLAGHETGAVQAAYGAAKVVQFAFPALWVVVACRQKLRLPIALTPCPSPERRGEIAGVREGLLLGVAVVIGMMLMYFLWLKPEHILAQSATLIASKARSFGMGSPATFIAGAVLLSSLHAFLEEYYWRWFLFGGLRRYMPVAAAIAVSALAFTAHHVVLLASFFGWLTMPAVFFSLCVAVGGAAWAWIYHRSGSLLGPWLSHALIDAGIFVVGYDVVFTSLSMRQ
jgi:membrane protease YdiL (CAAX protease family)